MATIIEFLGGGRDGLRISTASDDPAEVQIAGVCAAFSEGGRVGKRFWTASDAAIRTLQTGGLRAARVRNFRLNYQYEVVDCHRRGGDTVIAVRYLGQR